MRNSTLYKIGGTKTFRLASTKRFGKHGSNLQNLEKGMREIYIPDDGMIFVQVDQSGAEALIVAYLCRAAQYRKLFENNVKPHSYLAMHLFKDVWPKKMREHRLLTADDVFDINELIASPIDQLKKHVHWKNLDLIIKDSDNWSLTERYYYLAKQTEHSSNYDIQPPTFRMNILEKSGGKIVISAPDSEKFLGLKHSLFPEIKDLHERIKHQVETTKMLYNLHGHPYTITQPYIMESQWKELYAWMPQSTVAEITRKAYVALYQYIVKEKRRWDILADTHDSYLCQCPIGEEQECGAKMQEFMNQRFVSPVDGVEFSMRSEAQAGFNWSPAKKDKNQTGLNTIK